MEIETLANITKANTCKFIWKNIICQFEVLNSVISYNGMQFQEKGLKAMWSKFGIRRYFSIMHYPQANEQLESIKKC